MLRRRFSPRFTRHHELNTQPSLHAPANETVSANGSTTDRNIQTFIDRKILTLAERRLRFWIRFGGIFILFIGVLTLLDCFLTLLTTRYDLYFIGSFWFTHIICSAAALAYQRQLPSSIILDNFALITTFAFSGLYILLGIMSLRRRLWSSTIALILYSLDTLFLALAAPFAAALHTPLIFVMYKGMKACRRLPSVTAKLGELDQALESVSTQDSTAYNSSIT